MLLELSEIWPLEMGRYHGFCDQSLIELKAWSTAMAQHVETATDNKHTHKDLGLIMVNVYGFVFKYESSDKHTHIHTYTHTHGRYQTHYLPCFAVDKYTMQSGAKNLNWGPKTLQTEGVLLIRACVLIRMKTVAVLHLMQGCNMSIISQLNEI